MHIKSDNKRDAAMKYLKLPAEFTTPVKILQHCNPIALMESAYPSSGKSRFSIIVLDEAFSVVKKENQYYKIQNEVHEKLEGFSEFIDVLKHYRKKAPKDDVPEHYPIPVGGLGYLGYEYFNEIEAIQFQKEFHDCEYDCHFVFGRSFLVFDHFKDEMILSVVSYSGEDICLEELLEKKLKEIEEAPSSVADHSCCKDDIVIVEDNKKEAFKENVRRIKREIVEGNLIQCVISRSKIIKTSTDPKVFYRELRRENPSPYMFYLRLGKLILFGASPEIMVTVKGNKIVSRPIAGTRKRGTDDFEDALLEKELLSDPKERAEHLMLVDLARNDLGKVSKKNSVRVTEYMSVEKYASVMHICSNVESELEKNEDSFSAIKATFPAGTVSGAPKIQAIKTIEELEELRRGPYAGLVGYFKSNGDFDSCIVIRSAICNNGSIRLQAGAGIVYDSDPEREYQETEQKLASLLKVFKSPVGKQNATIK
ncbi:MAG: anthranilate synthase component I family protein [Thermotogota bacterium]